ncbi:hypothetical protein K3248_04245 [Candidatus Bartonella raoultii]|uniref:Phage related protein n=1 Tax=Bartonella raoultii TaxID=1457020 RepID=A0ABS7I827_9HYPH|nr:hypothetical protein [Bartonella raoultii]MBX4335802.1 hypothetical protein [Bartonella raoultii]
MRPSFFMRPAGMVCGLKPAPFANGAVKQALELLCRCNYIREIASDHSSKGGRPTIHYEWNTLVKSHKTSQFR